MGAQIALAKGTIVITMIVGLVVCVVLTACTSQPTQIPTPTPTPWPVKELYQVLHNEKESNSTRSERRVDEEWGVGITGRITKIEDDRVQFHIEVKEFKSAFFSGSLDFKDLYVECKFPKKSYVYQLEIGDTVSLYGKLDQVSNAVKFKDCRFLQ